MKPSRVYYKQQLFKLKDPKREEEYWSARLTLEQHGPLICLVIHYPTYNPPEGNFEGHWKTNQRILAIWDWYGEEPLDPPSHIIRATLELADTLEKLFNETEGDNSMRQIKVLEAAKKAGEKFWTAADQKRKFPQ